MFEKLIDKAIDPILRLLSRGLHALRIRTSRSKKWRFFSIFGAACFFYLVLHILASALVYKAFEEIDVIGKARNHDTAVNSLKTSIDYVTSCIEASENAETLSAWYCGKAKILFHNQKISTLKEYKDEIIAKQAYRVMRDELNKELRITEFDKTLESAEQYYTQALQNLATSYIWWLCLAAIVPFMLLLYWFLKTPPALSATPAGSSPPGSP